MNEQSYFEQFSGHTSTDDTWWDTWSIVYSGFIHQEYMSEDVAQLELNRLAYEFPEYHCHIVHTENAGYGNMRFKALGYPIYPIGGMTSV